jgi:hypothetical protein
MVTTTTPKPLSRDEIIEMFGQMKNVGSVELKVSVPGHQRAALAGLGLDLLQGRIREVYFFDTPGLDLFANGVVLRGRRTQGTLDDTVVKLRPAQPADLTPAERDSPNMKIEMDVTRGGYIVSASLKGERRPGTVRAAVTGDRPVPKLFTKEQRTFFERHGPEGVDWSDLVALGPAYVVVLKHAPRDLARKVTIEQWHYPGEVPLVELSTKAMPDTVLQVYADAATFLRARGLTAEGEQEPKTRKALEFYARQRANA